MPNPSLKVTIRIDSPGEGANLVGPTVQMSGTAFALFLYDGERYVEPSVAVQIGNTFPRVRVIHAGGGIYVWSCEAEVTAPGSVTITAQALATIDYHHHHYEDSDTDSCRIRILADDKPPSLTVEAPSEVTGPGPRFPIAVRGTASDDWGVASVKWGLGTADPSHPAQDESGDWKKWSAALELAHEGAHTITVRATDTQGNYRDVAKTIETQVLHGQPWNDRPVLLLPVRLETRFLGNDLWVRIYPDQIFIDTHEPRLTQAEFDAGEGYHQQDDKRDAWRELVRRFGSQRAAWIARITEEPEKVEIKTEEEGWLTAPRLLGLPDRFVVFAYRDDELICNPKPGNPIPPDLTVMPVPSPVTYEQPGGGTPGVLEGKVIGPTSEPITGLDLTIQGTSLHAVTDDAGWFRFKDLTAGEVNLHLGFEEPGSWLVQVRVGAGPVTIASHLAREELFDKASWMVDLQRAQSDGMAVCIENVTVEEISRIIVVGLRTSGAPEDQDLCSVGQRLLEELIDSHHYSTGLAFLKHGTPTNNTQTSQSGHSETTDDSESSYESEVLGSEGWDKQRANALCLGSALGLRDEHGDLKPEYLRYLAGSGDETADAYAREMLTALWPATGDYLLRYLLPGIVGQDDLPRLSRHFIDFVRGSGPLPAIRVGDQPYGILPVTGVQKKSNVNPRGWEASPLDNPDNDTWTVFDNQLHSILVRLQEKWLAWANDPVRVPRIGTTTDPDKELLQVLSMEPTSVSYRTRDFVDERFVAWLLIALRDNVFGPDTPYAVEDPLYWVQKWAETWRDKRREQAEHWHAITDAPADKLEEAPLLRLLSWWNVKDFAHPCDPEDVFCWQGLVQYIGDQEQEVPSDYLNDLCRLGSVEPTSSTLARDLLVRSRALAENASLNVRGAICDLAESLKTGAPPDIDRLFRETLDLVTHRLDAWITSLATKRLERMRSVSEDRASGIYLGAYGWVEDLQKSETGPQSLGYVHAPSAGQAAAAAVLNNAYLTHAHGTGANPFRINLNSERVRRSLRVLEGVRQGQPLGALLGYQFERALHERQLDQYIDVFRAAFPIVANKETVPEPGETIEVIAARNVVDGLALARWWDDPDRTDITCPDPDAERTLKEILEKHEHLRKVVKHLLQSLDAVNDLLMHEGVYQAVQGNHERAGAALEAASGNSYPPEIESIATPVTGKSLGHRVCMLFSEASGSQERPRAKAEPRLAAWAADVLGDLSRIGCRFEFRSERINVNEASEEELERLPGLEEAQNIIAYREHYGPFTEVEHLERVEGIEHTTVEAIRRWVMTGFETEEEDQYYERLNINDAPEDRLVTRLHIDLETARAITANRPFARIGDLQNVTGIEPDTVEAIRRLVTTGVDTMSVADLAIDAIDLFYLSATPPSGEETEIEQRITCRVREEFGLKHDTRVEIDFSRSSSFPYALGEALELGRQILDTLGTASVLQPGSLWLPAEAGTLSFAPDDVDELAPRVQEAYVQVFEIMRALDKPIDDGTDGTSTPNEIIGALFEASQYGIPGAIPPGPDDRQLDRRRQNVGNELQRRLKQLSQPLTVDVAETSAIKKISVRRLPWGASVQIAWQTPLRSRSHVDYGETAAYGQSADDTELKQDHLLTLTGLESGVTYHVRVVAQAEDDSLVETEDGTFDLPLPLSADEQVAQLLDAIKALFGRSFVALPTFVPHQADVLARAFGQKNLLAGLGEQRVRLWLQQAAEVHLPLRKLDDILTMVEAWGGRAMLSLQVAQLPFDAESRWLALDDDERGASVGADITSDRGILSIVAAVNSARPLPRVAGLLLEQWDELIPSGRVYTGVSFQYDGPNSQAPQALLLAVPSQREVPARPWQVEDLAEIVKDTMDLARVRAVDLDAMGETGGESPNTLGVGLMLPALMLPTDPDKPEYECDTPMQSIEDWLEAFLD